MNGFDLSFESKKFLYSSIRHDTITAILPLSNITLLEKPTIINHAAKVFAEYSCHVFSCQITLRSVVVHVAVVRHAVVVKSLWMLIRSNFLTVLISFLPKLILLQVVLVCS